MLSGIGANVEHFVLYLLVSGAKSRCLLFWCHSSSPTFVLLIVLASSALTQRRAATGVHGPVSLVTLFARFAGTRTGPVLVLLCAIPPGFSGRGRPVSYGFGTIAHCAALVYSVPSRML